MKLTDKAKEHLIVAVANEEVGNEIINKINSIDDIQQSETPSFEAAPSRLVYIDRTRSDSYTALGTQEKPFKTIQAALDWASAQGDGDSLPYSFLISTGTYPETVSLNDLGLFSISLTGQGRVAIDSLVSNSDNTDLQDLVVSNLEFSNSVTLVGSSAANNFKTTIFRDCSFSGALSATTLNNFAFWDVYAASTVSFVNTNYLYIGGGQILNNFTMQMDSNLTVPANGSTGGANIFGLICNDVSLQTGGVGVWNCSLHNTRAGLTAGNYTIPDSCNVTLYNSILRGTWTNNGTLALRNSHTDNAVLGTAPNVVSNRSEQISYVPANGAHWVNPDPTTVKEAIDRMAALLNTLNGGPV